MWIHTETTFGFNMPDDYDELKLFEKTQPISKARKSEDTIAVRYTFFNNTYNVAYKEEGETK